GRRSGRLNEPGRPNGTGEEGEGDTVAGSTAGFGGNAGVTTASTGEKPYLAGIRPKSFAPEPSGGGAAEVVKIDSVDAGRAAEAQVLDHHVEEQEGPKLEDADVVVPAAAGSAAPRRTNRLWGGLAR